MPLLSFSVFKNRLLNGSKTQTIRLPRKRPLKVGDKLFIYWKCRTKETEKLGEGIITDIKHLHLHEITGNLVTKDGFLNKLHLDIFFVQKYGHRASFYLFDVITWKWTSFYVKNPETETTK
jgi:hypothetical protein